MNVGFELNLGALMAVLLGVTLTRFLVMGHYCLHRKVYSGFSTFLLAEFFALVSLSSIFLRGMAGETVLLVFLSSLGPFFHLVFVFHGLGQYARAPKLEARTRLNVIVAVAACLAVLADLVVDPDITRRVVLFSAVSIFLGLRIALELPFLNRRGLSGLALLCGTFAISAGIHALRAWSTLGENGYDFRVMVGSDRLLAFFALYRTLQSVLEMYVVFSMNSQMLEDDLRTASAQIERMAQNDALTGVLNRRGLELLGGEALQKSLRQGQSASVIMLDLDHFKGVNDSLGHDAGDELLRAVAALCQSSLREGDVFARYGGEEFVIVAPGTDADEAMRLAERTRQAIANAHFAATCGSPVSASFGVASARVESLEALLKSADSAMYVAKQDGRNRVALAAPAHTATEMA